MKEKCRRERKQTRRKENHREGDAGREKKERHYRWRWRESKRN